ncbi:unnamed protein product [Mytilus edulis]|uniref:Integrase catalytic domain-containing protein n=1 Tax=Mytilus edulis TaxID=6550 RepID=A0A8S3SFF3_MYTED|nr:unnamed protein product [Mytilus edulis]
MQDSIIKIVRQWKVDLDVKPQWQEISHLSKIHKAYLAQWDRLVVVDGILYRKWINTIINTQSLQYILPHTFRCEVLKLLHDDTSAGHMGIKRTSARVRHRFYWVGYQTFVDKYCQRCIECQKRKGPSKGTRASIKTYVVGESMDRVAIDLLGPIPQTYNGNRYLMVITYYFTRYAEAYPIPNIYASTVADKMVTEFICRYGVPTQIHTDQGSQFTSDLFLQLCKLLHIDKTRIAPFTHKVLGCADDKYRLRQHETSRHSYHQFYPGDTPRHTGSLKSSVEREERTFPSRSQPAHTYPSTSTSPRQSEATIRQITALLDEQMPDFAELLNEPRTPSPMKRLRNEETTSILFVPSDNLFSKYLEPTFSISPEPFKDPTCMTYSPSDQPFISRSETPLPSVCTPTNPTVSPEPAAPINTPLDLTKTITPVYIESTNDEPMDLSKSSTTLLPTTSPEPLPLPSPVPVPSSLPSQSSETPLDLTINSYKTIQPAEIDCTLPTYQWNKSKEIKVDLPDYNDISLDPRLFFAGAPSSYLKHPLAKTLQEQINLCRKTRASHTI